MTFDEILAQVLALLQREGRLSYRALKRRFNVGDDYLEGLKDELIEAKRVAIDEGGKVLVWTGELGRRRRLSQHNLTFPFQTCLPISPKRFSRPKPPWRASASR